MVELLKNFGKGILYVIGFPFFLVVLAIFAAFGLIAFVFQMLKSILFFFTGQKFFPDLPEDKQLKALQAAKNERLLGAPNQSTPQMNLDALDVKKK